MTDTLTIHMFDQYAAELAKQEAIERVGDGASSWWMNQALDAIKHCADTLREFTTDDVWRIMPESVGVERRAMGAAMTKAAKAKLIKPTNRYIASDQVVCHRREKKVWVRAQ